MVAAGKLTIEDFEKLPDEVVRNKELVDGELVDVAGNTGFHNSLKVQLTSLVHVFVQERALGQGLSEQEYNFDGNAHGPDISFFGNVKADLFQEDRRVQPFVPDLAIEIVSRNDVFEEVIAKAGRYRNAGTKEAWVLDGKNRLAFVFCERGDFVVSESAFLESECIPGFRIRLGELLDRSRKKRPRQPPIEAS